MELLQEYDSESSSGALSPPPLPPSVMPTLPLPSVVTFAPDELEWRRQAVASTLSRQSSPPADHRHLTPAERAFEFRAYTSKRRHRDERALSPQQQPPQLPPLVAPHDADDAESSAGCSNKGLPTRIARRFVSHAGAVNYVQWSTESRATLFLSASMDASVRIWDVRSGTCRRTLQMHAKGVKVARWSLDGTRVLSGSYDGCAVYSDAETGAALHTYSHRNQREATAVTSACVHPSDVNLFLVGTDKGQIVSHDVRQTGPCRTLQKGFGDVHDLLFLSASGERFVSSAGIKYRDASHQTLLVWDFATGALLSDRLDRDLQPFCCLRLHPHAPRFVAQSSANYALMFSALEPFKRVNKGRSRFAGGHGVQGVSVQCSFSADGSVLATGDTGGRVFYYDATSKRVLRRLEPFHQRGASADAAGTACVCAEFQPHSRSNALVAGAFDGQLVLYERAKDTS